MFAFTRGKQCTAATKPISSLYLYIPVIQPPDQTEQLQSFCNIFLFIKKLSKKSSFRCPQSRFS